MNEMCNTSQQIMEYLYQIFLSYLRTNDIDKILQILRNELSDKISQNKKLHFHGIVRMLRIEAKNLR